MRVTKGPRQTLAALNSSRDVHIELDFLSSNLHSDNYLQVQVQFEVNEFIQSSKRV